MRIDDHSSKLGLIPQQDKFDKVIAGYSFKKILC